jgi:hypothetical protein
MGQTKATILLDFNSDRQMDAPRARHLAEACFQIRVCDDECVL